MTRDTIRVYASDQQRQVEEALDEHGFDEFVALVAITGSHAYGTDRPGSDWDYRGVYIAPPHECLRLRPPREQLVLNDPDMTVFELQKFARLATAANPNVLEVLWADPALDTAEGSWLRASRQAFLSRRVRGTYGGYAKTQLGKAQRGSGGSRGVKHFKREKFVLHLFRLFEQGLSLLSEGDMDIRVHDPERLWAQAMWPLDKVEREFAKLDGAMDLAMASSPLPETPDYEAIDVLLWKLRGMHPLDEPGDGLGP